MLPPSLGVSRSSSLRSTSNYSRSFHLADDDPAVASAMLPVFLNHLTHLHPGSDSGRHSEDLVELELELDQENIYVCSVTPRGPPPAENNSGGLMSRSLSAASSVLRKLRWPRSSSVSSSDAGGTPRSAPVPAMMARENRRRMCQMQKSSSRAQRALSGLRFISKKTTAKAEDAAAIWEEVVARFDKLADEHGLLPRERFAECIGMRDSKEFAIRIFNALAKRKRQRIIAINKEQLYDFWLMLSDQSFDARLQIFFDMVDSNDDGKITRDEVQELIKISAAANKLSSLNERAHEYADLIMEELDTENFGYIELWQLEALLLQRDVYMEYSRPLSTVSGGWSQNFSNNLRPKSVAKRACGSLKCLIRDHWQRAWIVLLWIIAMILLFTWKFLQYRKKAAFQVMGYCLSTAKGAAETLKLNMALILLPVSRNTLTWLQSTRARLFIPFNDNINFHKTIACAIVVGVVLHVGNHLACDFPRLVNSSPDKFALIASNFNYKKPTYGDLLSSIEGGTGIAMVVLMAISFTLATRRFRRNVIKLPPPFNRLAGYNAFWYSHHLLGLVYLLLIVHGFYVFLVKKWILKTTWMYLSVPLILYVAERSLRTCRSEIRSVKILKVAELPGNAITISMTKPQGFKYKSGQYIFLQCPAISKFEWHPFSITSAPGDNYLSVHIRIVGDWTQELRRVFTEGRTSATSIGRLKFEEDGSTLRKGSPRLYVDGPYGAPAQDYRHYDVLLLVGLGIGATPFISILKDLLNNARALTDSMSNTDLSISYDSLSSFASFNTAQSGNRRMMRVRNAHFYWVTREPESFEWFKGVMHEVAELDDKGLIEMHNYLTSVYEEGDARSTLLTMVQALNHAKYGVDILSGTQVKTHFARPKWKEVFVKIARKRPNSTVGVFYCGRPVLAKELKKLAYDMSLNTTTRFEFHKEQF